MKYSANTKRENDQMDRPETKQESEQNCEINWLQEINSRARNHPKGRSHQALHRFVQL